MVLVVLRGYVYLDNVFTAEDIRKQLPKETDDFDKLTSELIEITSGMASYGLALPATHNPRTYRNYEENATKAQDLARRFLRECVHGLCCFLCASTDFRLHCVTLRIADASIQIKEIYLYSLYNFIFGNCTPLLPQNF